MTLWYAGATFFPKDPALVAMSVEVYNRSKKAAVREHVAHPDDEIEPEYDVEYDVDIPF